MNLITIDFLKDERLALIDRMKFTKSKVFECKNNLESLEKIFIDQNDILHDLNKIIGDGEESHE